MEENTNVSYTNLMLPVVGSTVGITLLLHYAPAIIVEITYALGAILGPLCLAISALLYLFLRLESMNKNPIIHALAIKFKTKIENDGYLQDIATGLLAVWVFSLILVPDSLVISVLILVLSNILYYYLYNTYLKHLDKLW